MSTANPFDDITMLAIRRRLDKGQVYRYLYKKFGFLSLDEVFMNARKPLSTQRVVILSIIGAVVICLVIGVVAIEKLPLNPTTLALRAALSEIVGVVDVRNSPQEQFNQVTTVLSSNQHAASDKRR